MKATSADTKPMTACPVCKSYKKPLPRCSRCGGEGEIVDIYKLGPELQEDGTYCAPWCGRGCTMEEHNLAHQEANALAENMGDGWTPRVWENLGWHYSVRSPCDRIRVHPHHHKGAVYSYCAYLGEKGGIGGKWTASHKNPKKAVERVIKEAQKDLAKLGALLEDLPTA